MVRVGADANGKTNSAWTDKKCLSFSENLKQYFKISFWKHNISHLIALIIFVLAHVALVNILNFYFNEICILYVAVH